MGTYYDAIHHVACQCRARGVRPAGYVPPSELYERGLTSRRAFLLSSRTGSDARYCKGSNVELQLYSP